jgi:hypothetical protein
MEIGWNCGTVINRVSSWNLYWRYVEWKKGADCFIEMLLQLCSFRRILVLF